MMSLPQMSRALGRSPATTNRRSIGEHIVGFAEVRDSNFEGAHNQWLSYPVVCSKKKKLGGIELTDSCGRLLAPGRIRVPILRLDHQRRFAVVNPFPKVSSRVPPPKVDMVSNVAS
jgi:hypothetical protein